MWRILSLGFVVGCVTPTAPPCPAVVDTVHFETDTVAVVPIHIQDGCTTTIIVVLP